MIPLETLPVGDLQYRLKCSWRNFTYVGCMIKPSLWEFRKIRLFKKLVEDLRNEVRKELRNRGVIPIEKVSLQIKLRRIKRFFQFEFIGFLCWLLFKDYMGGLTGALIGNNLVMLTIFFVANKYSWQLILLWAIVLLTWLVFVVIRTYKFFKFERQTL